YLDTQESRGLVPADHPSVVGAMRGVAMGEADLVVVVGRKLDGARPAAGCERGGLSRHAGEPRPRPRRPSFGRRRHARRGDGRGGSG
ncbi:hypothetical protein CNY89_28475, partial [Amaricoccus sp. HAR-UPW-R2A-40]